MTCQGSSTTTTTMLAHKFHRLHLRNSPQFRCVLDQIAPNLAVSASLSSVFTSANVIATASGTSSLHGAVTSTITQVAVTAVAIASGACLSTKVDFLWPKMEAQPGSDVVEGVDVTGYPIFNDPKVQKAVAFAKKAHHGQLRKTGDPYLVHCIHTGRILAMLVPASGERAVETVVAGILHDVVDDTCVSFSDIQQEFGDHVAKLVAGVSRLSYINQLLRRRRRINVNQGKLGHEEANNLRVMLLGMVDDPRVVLIKLADRLHNMRTIYALPLPKAQAVARETLVIWCSLASRLGLWAMKAELEDLCFAVLQPEMFKKMRADLASMWSSSNKVGNSKRKSSLLSLNGRSSISDNEGPVAVDEDVTTMKDLLEAVVPFDVLLDRRKRSKFLNALGQGLETHRRAKVVQDAGIALASMVICVKSPKMEVQSICRGIPISNFGFTNHRILPPQIVFAGHAGRRDEKLHRSGISSKSYLNRGAIKCVSNSSRHAKLEFSGGDSSNVPVKKIDGVEPFRGKSGSISFYGLTHQLAEEGKLISAPFDEEKGSFIWFIAPVALISSLILPQFFIGNAVEAFLKDETIVEIVTSLSYEALFYVGLAIFLLVTDKVQRPYLQFSPKRWGLITGLRGYLTSAFLTTGFKVMAPLFAVYVTWPLLGFPALISVIPFLVGCVAQLAFETVLEKRQSSCWPLVPIIFEVYRLYQLTKATSFIQNLMFAMNGLPTSPELLEKSGALFAMMVTFRVVSLVCLWSLTTFLLRLFPSRPVAEKY